MFFKNKKVYKIKLKNMIQINKLMTLNNFKHKVKTYFPSLPPLPVGLQ